MKDFEQPSSANNEDIDANRVLAAMNAAKIIDLLGHGLEKGRPSVELDITGYTLATPRLDIDKVTAAKFAFADTVELLGEHAQPDYAAERDKTLPGGKVDQLVVVPIIHDTELGAPYPQHVDAYPSTLEMRIVEDPNVSGDEQDITAYYSHETNY